MTTETGARTSRPGRRRGLVETAWLALLLVILSLLFLARYNDPRKIVSGDSFWYMRQALMYTGLTKQEAHTEAARQICREINRSLVANGHRPECVEYTLAGISPRYIAIFDSRPGYPLFASPFVAVLGAWTGMMAATMVLALLAATLAYLAVWMASGLRLAGVLSAVAMFLLPTGFLMTRMLTEGGVMAGYLASIIGGMLVLRGRRSGFAIIAASLVWLFAFRSASGMAMALALLAAGALAALRREHRRTSLILVATGAVAVLGWQLLSSLLHLPSLNDTIQDYATGHFTAKPDVPHPISWLIDRDLDFWPTQLKAELTVPTTLAAFGFAVAVLIIKMRPYAPLWIFTGLTGVMMVAAHPLKSQYDRLMLPLWLPVALAFGYAAALALRPATARLSGAGSADDPTGTRPAPVIPQARRPEPSPGEARPYNMAGDTW
ncbi:integral membrane protein [Actinoplanes sp. SE50]|uniref:hypothetical protein n=1 Tax=unclassified Actinoplanes TaxID=2626549 RepID=UPI00023EC63E|nr:MULTISPECIES: hypothetical protein [unclassified Actinoplanes]AEV85286.1 integral membrane protein [Actinoplanes sp. SE50/110]ATO83681.1 integral membrane protein [Actinoplanes sp. SE50]SLM01089.1 uncharacterized protein ACSP50_4322 [Actinoplanes sp. SE50/110]